MIFAERTIRVTNGASQINSPIVLYKGDKNIKIRFKIVDCPYTYSKNVGNIIEVSEASYAQLVIKVPNDEVPIFSDIAETESGYVTFTITGEMIDEAEEVGKYSFQVRLLDDEQFSRITIPEVVDGIEVREPIAIEGVSATNEVDIAMVNYAVATASTPEDAFDSQGNYNKTIWGAGDRITATKLNKIEAGIEGINQKVASGETSGGSNINDTTASATTTYSSNRIESIKENLSSQIKEKVNKGESGVITNAMLSQEVKEAMTGGSVADGAVTPQKTTFFKRVNLFNYETSTAGERITDITGNLISDASFDTSDFIEVEPLINYTLNIANYDTVFIYDASKTVIEKFNLEGWGIVVNTITMPENAKYVRISYLNAHETEIMFVKGNKIPNEYCSYDDLILEYPKQHVFDEIATPETSSLQGTYLFFGDSICHGDGYQGGYSKIIAENNPDMVHVNYGVSGSCVAKRTSRTDSVLEKVASAQDEADFIVLEGGVNDAWSSEIELGDFNASSPLTSSYISNLVDTTYTGALETLFNNVQTKWPGKLVFFIIPHNMDLPNTKSYMDRAEEVCQKWGVILIDLRKLSGMNTYNEYIKTTYTNASDGVHPNQAGYEKYYIKPITNILIQYK